MRLFLPIFTLFYSFLLFAGPTFDTATVETALKLPYLSSGQSLYLNGTTVSSQVTNSPLVLSNGTLSIPVATSGANGYLSSTDWSIFNGKQSTVSASSPLSISANNVTIQAANGSQNGYLSSADWTSFSGKQSALIFSSPLSLSGTTASIQVATSGQNGYLSSADWSTFNSKQAGLAFSSPLMLSGTTASINYLAPITTTSGSLSIPASTNSVDGYLTAADHTTFNSKQATVSATAPVVISSNVVSINKLAPLTTTGGSLSIPVATSSVDGYLAQGDWTTFNNKQATISVSAPILLSGASLSLGTVAIANGGTGQTTAANAINALLPDQSAANGKFLTSNGSVASWGTTSGGGGASTSLTTKGDIQTYSTSNDRLPVGSDGQILTSDSQNGTLGIGWKTPLYKNYVKNPNCKVDVSNITVTTGTIARNTSTPLDTQSDCAISATASGGKYSWGVNTFDNALTAIASNCEAKFNYTGTATAFKAYVAIGGTTQTASLRGTLDSSGLYDLNFPCAAGTATLNIEATATTSAINVANLYVGPQTNIGSVNVIGPIVDAGTMVIAAVTTAPTKATMITDKVRWYRDGKFMYATYVYDSSGTGVNGTGDYEFLIPSGLQADTSLVTPFTGANLSVGTMGVSQLPISGMYWVAAPGSGFFNGASLYDSTHFRVNVDINGGARFNLWGSGVLGLSNTSLSFQFTVRIPIAGWTDTSNAVRSDQTDLPWTAYTPTLTGMGSATNISFFYRRNGEDLEVNGTYTSGTTTAVLGSVTLPNGLTINTSAISIANTSSNPGMKVGEWSNNGSNQQGNIITATGTSTSLVYFAAATGAGGYLTPVNMNSNLTGGGVVAVHFYIPASGWSVTQNAPVLINSITTKSNTSKVFSVVEFNNSGSCSVASDPEGMIASVSDPGTGLCGITLTTGYFTAAPKCWCNATLKPLVAAYECETEFGGSATAGTTYTATSAGVDSDQPFTLFCLGQRN